MVRLKKLKIHVVCVCVLDNTILHKASGFRRDFAEVKDRTGEKHVSYKTFVSIWPKSKVFACDNLFTTNIFQPRQRCGVKKKETKK